MNRYLTVAFLFLLLASIVSSVPMTIKAAGDLTETPDFSITADPNSLTVNSSSPGFSIITVTSLNGFNGTVNLSISPGAPGFVLSLNPLFLDLSTIGTAKSTLTVGASTDSNVGFNATVSGFSGGLSHSTIILVNGGEYPTPGFTIIGPALFQMSPGSTGSTTVFLTSQNNFNGIVSLASGINPNGPVLTLNPADVIVAPANTGQSILTFSADSSTLLGSYNYTITGTAIVSGGTLTRSFVGQLIIGNTEPPDFIVDASPLDQMVVAGSNATSVIILTSVNGFNGNITLSTSRPDICTGCPTWSVSPTLVALTGGTAAGILTFNSFPGTFPVAWPVYVTGTSGSLSHTIPVSFTVVASPPDFSISSGSTTVTIPSGQSATVQVTLTSLNSFTGTVDLQTSQSPACAPQCTTWSLNHISLSLAPGASATSTLTILAGTLGGSGNITVRGISGTLVHSSVVEYKIMLAPDFVITASPNHVTFTSGSSDTSTISVIATGGFNSTVFFAISSSQGLLANIAPQNVTAPGSAILFLSGMVPGNYTAVVTGTSGSLGHTVALLVTVIVEQPPDFVIASSAENLTVTAGSTIHATITLTSLNSFGGTVSLSATVSSPDVGVTLSPAMIVIQTGETGQSILTITSSSSTVAGIYIVTITATSGQTSHATILLLTVTSLNPVPSFSVSSNLTFLLVNVGSIGTATINLTSLNGFAGTVSVAAVSDPSGLLLNFNPTDVTLVDGGTANSILTIEASSSTIPGAYQVNVTAANGSIVQMVVIFVTVEPRTNPDFVVSAGPDNVTLTAGMSANSTITITSIRNFNGTVTLFVTTSTPRILAILSGSGVDLSPNQSVDLTLTIVASSLTVPGIYNVTLTATGGSLSHSTIVLVIIEVAAGPPSFTVHADPTILVVTPGGSSTSAINVTGSNGFTGTVLLSSRSSPSGLAISIDPASIILLAGGTGDAILSVSTTSATLPGTYLLTVTGTSGNETETVVLTVTVSTPPPPPDFSIKISPIAQTIHKGQTATYTITITGTEGFNGTVSLATSITPLKKHGLQLTLPSTIDPDTISTLTVTTANNTSRTTYAITITAISGSLTHTFTVLLTVTS